MKRFDIICAIDSNGGLGKKYETNITGIPWNIKEDLLHFSKTTQKDGNNAIVMGRKTWESIGAKPLPKRRHIIITRNADYAATGAEVVTSVEAALALIENDEQPFIVGGAEIYKLAMPFVKRLELTYVHNDFEGDTYFPEFDKNEWEVTSEVRHEADETHKWPFTFVRLDRR